MRYIATFLERSRLVVLGGVQPIPLSGEDVQGGGKPVRIRKDVWEFDLGTGTVRALLECLLVTDATFEAKWWHSRGELWIAGRRIQDTAEEHLCTEFRCDERLIHPHAAADGGTFVMAAFNFLQGAWHHVHVAGMDDAAHDRPFGSPSLAFLDDKSFALLWHIGHCMPGQYGVELHVSANLNVLEGPDFPDGRLLAMDGGALITLLAAEAV